VGGANAVDLAEQALATGHISGSVSPPTASVAVDETVDRRAWHFTATPDSQGNYAVDVLAGTAHVTLSADGYTSSGFDIDVAAGQTATATPVSLSLIPVPVTLSASVSPAAPVEGDDVTLDVTMAPAVPGATIDVAEGSTALGSASVGAGGTASVTLSGLAAGTHHLTVSFAGDAGHEPASATVDVTVAAASSAPVSTRLSIEYPRTLRDLLALLFGRYELRVDLTTSGGVPVAGQPVTISTWHGELCQATTDKTGAAGCLVPQRAAGEVLAGLVYAEFAGSDDYLASSAGVRPPTRHSGHGNSGHGNSGHGGGWFGALGSWSW
jgi:hypothetical protein